MKLNKAYKQGLLAALCLPASFCLAAPASSADALTAPTLAHMASLTDDELAATNGQALFNMSYLAPGDANNNQAGVGFYKLGIEGDMAINANIRKLQLGCGGINGAGACDIDIDNFSMSGGDGSTRAGRVGSDTILTNPFFQIAIENPGNPALRKVVGFRISSEAANGLLTFGEENSTTPNGINSLSGYLNIGQATGTAVTQTRSMTKASTGKDMTGRIRITDLGGATLNFSSDTYSLNLASGSATVTTPASTVVVGQRMSYVDLLGSATIAPIVFSGTMTANVNLGFDIPLEKNVTGQISGLTATVPIQQSLGFIHKLPLGGNPFSLSLQGQSVFWPGAVAAAQRGWWMAFEDKIDIGNISPTAAVPITDAVLSQALGPQGCSNGATPGINCALYASPIECKAFGSPNCLGGGLPVGNVNITGTNVLFPLNNLQLSAQGFAPNCWGSSKFC